MFNRPQPNYKREFVPIEQVLERGRAKSAEMWANATEADYDDPLLREPSCPICCDKGFVSADARVDDPQFGKAITCPNPTCAVVNENRARRQAILLKKSRNSGIPSHYADLRFDNWRSGWRGGLTKAQRQDKLLGFYAAQAFAEAENLHVDMLPICEKLRIAWDGSERPKNSLIFWGDVGTGKTALLACIAFALMERGIDVTWYRGSELIEKIRTTYKRDPELDTDDMMELLKTPPVLVIDEMVMTATSADSTDKMETIIDYRLNEGLPTVASCNGGFDAFEHVWGIRSLSRMKAAAHWVRVGGDDLRDTR